MENFNVEELVKNLTALKEQSYAEYASDAVVFYDGANYKLITDVLDESHIQGFVMTGVGCFKFTWCFGTEDGDPVGFGIEPLFGNDMTPERMSNLFNRLSKELPF